MKRNNKTILVRKASGEQEPFDVQKLIKSLSNAGANEEVIDSIVGEISKQIHDGISTRKIYSRAFKLLSREKRPAASRYKLKQAIMELGPTGYPFEHFIAQILEKQGYKTRVGLILQGHCVNHEVDVVAQKEDREIYVECKYAQNPGKIFNVQVPLYIRSRVNDIIQKVGEVPGNGHKQFEGMVVTNTRFSADAITYARCSGLQVLSWDYPMGRGLKDIIDAAKIYPITVLTQLTRDQKRCLLEKRIVQCSQLLENVYNIDCLKIKEHKIKSLLNELSDVLS